MKKKIKNLLILIGIMIALLVGYVAIDFYTKTDTEEEETKEEITFDITEFTKEDISFYSYKNAGYEIGFYVTEDGYTHYEDTTFPVKEESILAQIEVLGDLKAIQEITSIDRAEYGLETPQLTILVTLSNGTTRNFLIGDKALFEDAYYLLDEENNQIYLVEEDIYDEFSCTWSSLVQTEEIPMLTTDQIIEVVIEKNEEVVTKIYYDEELEYPWQIETSQGTVAGNTTTILTALEVFNSYKVRNVFEYRCNDFSKYGLEAPETVVIVHYMVSEEEGNETLRLEFGDLTEEENYYTRINGSSYVYEMSSYYVGKLCGFDVEELKLQVVESEE